jgi:hypothetical protein
MREYENKVDHFYREYNDLEDELRENLLTIIDESYDILTFNPNMIVKEPPSVPNQQIDRFKSTLEKTKRFYKGLSSNLDEIKEKSLNMAKLSIYN